LLTTPPNVNEDYKLRRQIAQLKEQLAFLQSKVDNNDVDIARKYAELKITHDLSVTETVDPIIWNNVLSSVEYLLDTTKKQEQVIEDINAEVGDIAKERNMALDKLDDLTSDNEKLTLELSEAKNEIMRLLDSNASLKQSCDVLQDTITTQNEKVNQLTLEKENQKNQITQISQILAEITKERDTLALQNKTDIANENKNLKERLEHATRIEKLYREMQNQFRALQEKAHNVEMTLVFCQDNLDKKDDQIEELRRQVEQM
jgi:chromosome segregation ATPase